MLLSENIASLLNEQIKHEHHNHQVYKAISEFYADLNYDGFYKLFDSQASGELDHEKSIIKYMNDKNARVTIQPCDSVQNEFINIEDTIKVAYDLEISTTQKLYNVAKNAMTEGDFGTFNFLQDLIKEQIEEEKLFIDLRVKLELLGVGLLDQELRK